MSNMIWFHLPINPEPWAIGPVGYRRSGGKMGAYVGQNKQLNAFKEAVREEVASQWGGLPPLEGAIQLEIFFWRQRADYSTPAARVHRKHEADVTNMQKATEDALQGILFHNDRDNLDVHSRIIAQGPHDVGQIVIGIRVLEDDWRDEALAWLPVAMRTKVSSFVPGASPVTAVEEANVWPPRGAEEVF